MGKVTSTAVALALLLTGLLAPLHSEKTRAQASSQVSCAGTPSSFPMQGHYTGTWHSAGDYHFYVFKLDVELKVVIDGTMDVTVGADGRFSGRVNGKVDAPLYHSGVHDIGSGFGEIAGDVTGIVGASGGLAVLQHPVIFMHWGTFVGDGSTQDRYITMPDYQFLLGSSDCVSTAGTIAEKNFPQQILVADEAGQITHSEGIGGAEGAWQLRSDKYDRFVQLSQQVDSFITEASRLLADPPSHVTPASIRERVAMPLAALRDSIRRDPDVSRCLLDQIAQWEVSVVQPLLRAALGSTTATEAESLRPGSDFLRSAHLLNLDCSIAEQEASSALLAAARHILDRQMILSKWLMVALTIREMLLLTGETDGTSVQTAIVADMHSLVSATSDQSDLLDAARMAYALGDSDDSAAAVKRLLTHAPASIHTLRIVSKSPMVAKKKKKKKKPTSTPTPVPTATPTVAPPATPTVTPTPRPQTAAEILWTGVNRLNVSSTVDVAPVFRWQAVSGASGYVVVVTDIQRNSVLWTWSGADTSVTYGDTALPGVAGSENDLWPIGAHVAGYSWSLIAFNSSGKIIGASFGQRS